MSDSCTRKLSMLRLIPRAPRKISTRELLDRLGVEGFNTSQRTIQRDLKDIAVFFPDLKTDGNKDVAGWYWDKNGEFLSIPAIDPPVAFTLRLADTFLSGLMPPAITNLLTPFRKASQNVLASTNQPKLAKWQEKVQILPRTQQLIPADIDPQTIQAVYNALFEGKRFSARYQPRADDREIGQYEFNPLGIVYRESVIYLVATIWDYEDPRHYALHRFDKAELLDTPARVLKGFKLVDYIECGSFDYGRAMDKKLKLKALFKSTGKHLLETPLSMDQKITKKRDGLYLVSATVKDSLQIRWWLLGFGDQVEVLQPKALRMEFEVVSRNMCNTYNGK